MECNRNGKGYTLDLPLKLIDFALFVLLHQFTEDAKRLFPKKSTVSDLIAALFGGASPN